MWSLRSWDDVLAAQEVLQARVAALQDRLDLGGDEATPALVLVHLRAISETVQSIEATAQSMLARSQR